MESLEQAGPSEAFIYSEQEASTSKRKTFGYNGNSKVKEAKCGGDTAIDDVQEYGRQTYVKEESSENSFMPGESAPKRSQHGVIFQLKLLMLVLWRAVHAKENGQPKYAEFRLATEMPEAEHFDDVSFQFKEVNADKWKCRLMQVKNKEKKAPQDPVAKIKLGHLLSTNDNEAFSVQKYFRSFLKIKRGSRHEESSIDSVFPGTEIEDILVVTNTDFDLDTKKNIVFQSAGNIADDPLFRTCKQDSSMCKLDLSNEGNRIIIDKFKIIFESTSDFYRLVETLADHFCNNKKIDKNIPIFKDYYHPLVRKILKVFKSKSKDNKDYFFIDLNILINREGLNKEELKIRGALMKEIAFRKGTIKIPNIDESFIHSSMLPTNEKELEELAAILAKNINNDQELAVKAFQNYHVALTNEVIDVEEKKFHQNFIREPEKPKEKEPSILGKFKLYLKTHLKSGQPQIKQGITNDDLKSMTFNIAEDFGRRSLSSIEGISLSRLAKKIAEFIKQNKKITLEDFQDYPGLAKQVFDKDTGKFTEIFVIGQNTKGDKLSPVGKKLRRCLLSEMYNMDIKIQISNQNITIKEFETEFPQDLFSSWEVAVSEGFATSIIQEKNPEIEDVNLFAIEVCKLLKSQDKKQRIIELNANVQTNLGMENEVFKKFINNIKKLGGYVLINRCDKLRFSTAFLKADFLPGNLGQFKAKLIESLGKYVFLLLDKYEFKLDEDFKKQFKTCEDGELFKKLPVEHNEEDVKEFFQVLKFVVNFPNRNKISNLLGKEIKNKFKILDGRAFGSLYYEHLHNWMADRVGTFYSAAKAEKLFGEIEDDLALWTIDGRNNQYFADTSKYKFKKHGEFCHFLSGKEKVLHLVFEDLTLGRTRIVQTFQELKKEDSVSLQKYTRGFGYIFLYLKLLGNDDFRSEVFRILAKVHHFKLIVIEVNTTNSIPKLSKQLQTAIKKDKKIVFITTKSSDYLAKQFRNGDPEFDKTSVDDVEDIWSKKYLLQEKCIIFQGQRKMISLSDLMHIDVDDYLQNNKVNLSSVICTKTLIRFVSGKVINIGHALPLHHAYDKDFYIHRRFSQAVILNEDKIQQDIEENKKILKSDVLVINGICRKLTTDHFSVFDASEIESKEIEYDSNIGASIHWLKSGSEKLTFDRTQGSISNLVHFREIDEEVGVFTDSEDLIEEDNLIDCNSNKTVIIVNGAGMGKSTVLTHLSVLLKENNPSMWIIRINLKEISKVLNTETKNRKDEKPGFSIDVNTAFEFLTNEILPSRNELKFTSRLEKYLFKNSFEIRGSIALMFDGFDEISPDYEDVTINLIQALSKSGAVKLFVTTRPNMRTLLECKLGVFSSMLIPFSPEDKMEFLIKFWTKKLELNDLNQEQKNQLKNYAEALIERFFSSIHDETFTAIPLHIGMLAEVFTSNREDQQTWQGCKEFLNTKKAKPVLPHSLDLCDLYRHFVNTKFKFIHLKGRKERNLDIVGEEKRADEECKILEEKHEILALCTLFGEEVLEGFLLPEKLKNVNGLAEEINIENVGIFDIINDESQFIHRTFADYFTANFVGIRQSWGNENELRELILTKILIGQGSDVIHTFLHIYRKKEELNREVWSEGMLKLLDIAYSYSAKVDASIYNLLEKIVMKREAEVILEKWVTSRYGEVALNGGEEEEKEDDIRRVLAILTQHGYKMIFNGLIGSFFMYAFNHEQVDAFAHILSEYIDNEKLVWIMRSFSLPSRVAGGHCKREHFNFAKLLKNKGLTSTQLVEIFDNPQVWQDLAPGNYHFINMMKQLLDESTVGRILWKHYHNNVELAINTGLNQGMIPDDEYEKIQMTLATGRRQMIQEAHHSPQSKPES